MTDRIISLEKTMNETLKEIKSISKDIGKILIENMGYNKDIEHIKTDIYKILEEQDILEKKVKELETDQNVHNLKIGSAEKIIYSVLGIALTAVATYMVGVN